MNRQATWALMAILFAAVIAAPGGAAAPMPAAHALRDAQQTATPCANPTLRALLDLINAYRTENGRQPLAVSPKLSAAAQHHAESMATFNYFGYTLQSENITFDQNIHAFGYPGTYVGADIAAGVKSIDAATVLGQWQAAPSQRSNLLNPRFAAIGLGNAANPEAEFVNYWVATFGDDTSDAAPCPLLATPASFPTESTIATATSVATDSPTLAATETATASPSATATFASTATSTTTTTVTPTSTAIPTSTPTATASLSPSAIATATYIPSVTGTATMQPAATATASPTDTVAPIASPIAFPIGSPVAVASPIGGSPVAAASPVAGAVCASSRAGAKAGQDVVITCAGFAPGEVVDIFFDRTRPSDRVGTFTADASGAGTVTFLAPEIPSAMFAVIARGQSSALSISVPLEIRPAIYVTPKSGDPGDVITADLTGFQANETVTITWYDTATSVRLLRKVTAGEDGSLTTTFRAPGSTPGTHTIAATGLDGASATTTFDIKSH